jgi:1-acyl-sn-glycerol-3-phosphate acyltransferase
VPEEDSVFSIIRCLIGEIHPQWKHLLFTPETHLEHELGLNRPARMELCKRIEEALDIKLDESTRNHITTPLELVRSVMNTRGTAHATRHGMDITTSSTAGTETATEPFAPAEAGKQQEPRRYRRIGEWFYAVYAYLVFLTLGLSVWVLMLVTPSRNWRQHIARYSTRLLFKGIFISLKVSGQHYLDKDRPQIVVANHASYLDGLILTASLGIPVNFIVKAELSRILPIRLLLQRFGVEFVDRFNAGSGAGAIRRIARKSENGCTLVFFPEGTFTCFAGLQPFRMGAFFTAARTGVPVVPVAIRGARKILCDRYWLPVRGLLEVRILAPIMPEGDSRHDAEELRDKARHQIGAHCGEPDLVTLSAS